MSSKTTTIKITGETVIGTKLTGRTWFQIQAAEMYLAPIKTGKTTIEWDVPAAEVLDRIEACYWNTGDRGHQVALASLRKNIRPLAEAQAAEAAHHEEIRSLAKVKLVAPQLAEHNADTALTERQQKRIVGDELHAAANMVLAHWDEAATGVSAEVAAKAIDAWMSYVPTTR